MILFLLAEEGIEIFYVYICSVKNRENLVDSAGDIGDSHTENRGYGVDISCILEDGCCIVEVINGAGACDFILLLFTDLTKKGLSFKYCFALSLP